MKSSIPANRTNIFYFKCSFTYLEVSTRRWKAQSETIQDKIQAGDYISLRRIIAGMTTHCIQNPEMLTLLYGRSSVMQIQRDRGSTEVVKFQPLR